MHPIPKQILFMAESERYRFMLYGGSRGSAKSYILRWGLLWRLIDWFTKGHKDLRVGLFCEDYPTLRDRQISKIRTEFPKWLGEVKSTQTDGLGFYLHEDYGGGVILLRNLDDPSKYIGAEFAGIAVDELTKNDKATFDMLRGSLRWPGIRQTFFWGATNPLGPGVLWVRQLWIEQDFPPEFEKLKDEFCFVRALPYDNPHLSEQYWDDLRSQPAAIQKAWIEGDWYALVGAVFGEWREDQHVLHQFTVPSNWVFAAGCDWGYRANGWIGLFACGPEGDVVCITELYFKGQHSGDVGYAFGLMVQPYGVCGYVACDEQMWQKSGVAAPTLAEEFQEGIFRAFGNNRALAPKVIESTHGPGSRLAKLSVLHRYLHWQADRDGTVQPWNRPLLRFTKGCRAAIRTIPALPYDPTKTEDVDTDAEDHAYDGVCAFLMSRPPLAEEMDRPIDPNVHPGITRHGRKRRWQRTLEGDALGIVTGRRGQRLTPVEE